MQFDGHAAQELLVELESARAIFRRGQKRALDSLSVHFHMQISEGLHAFAHKSPVGA